jgi:hypothetical protein
MTDEIDLLIDEEGTVRFVHDDLLVDVFDGEQQQTTRASNVEPWRYGGWYADMTPSGGPAILLPEYAIDSLNQVIGRPRGFRTRQEALQAERDWLRRERGL